MEQNAIDQAAHARQLDATVQRLTTEVAALSREVASLARAVDDIQSQQLGRRLRPHAHAMTGPRPSNASAAMIVVIAGVLLAWQAMMAPRAGEPPRLASGARPAPVELAARVEAVRPAPTAPIVYRGTLAVAADQPAAEVFINRQRVGVAPVRVANLRAGSHLVWIESEGHRRWTRVVTVPYERVTRVKADLEPLDMH